MAHDIWGLMSGGWGVRLDNNFIINLLFCLFVYTVECCSVSHQAGTQK